MSGDSETESTGIDWHTGVPLASGGSGEIVRAYSARLGREIAIKYLRLEEPAAIERMLREARTQASLVHPHILPIHATGIHLGRHYIAMDVVDGEPLDQAMADMSSDARLRVFDQVLDAMAHAHVQSVVHRDLKPANLMVEERSGQAHAWVMDFGLARRPQDSTLTVIGDALGTPGYMAPEQARGSEGSDPRADVYALGVVLYQVMTGRLPYRADTPMALVMQAASGQTIPVTEIRRQLPDGLARIIARCLELDPARRYADAGQLRADIHSFMGGQTVDAPVLGKRYRLARWARANPWQARLAAMLVAVVVAGGVTLAVIGERNRQALNMASELIAEAERARGDWYVDQLLPLHDQRQAERTAMVTVDRLERGRDGLDGTAAARVDAAMADLLDAIGEPALAFQRASRAWQAGVQTPSVASRAARARLRQFGGQRLELGLTADPVSLPELLEQLRGSLADDLAPFRASLSAALQTRVERALDEAAVPVMIDHSAPPSTPAEWQDRLLDIQPVAAAAVEHLNIEGVSGLAEIERVEAVLLDLTSAVRSYRPAYRIGCQLESARQSLRTMQSDSTREQVRRDFCTQGLMLNPDDPDLLASSSMHYWQRAKDLRRNRAPYEEPLNLAISQAEKALDIQPDNGSAQIALGSALQILGRRQMTAGENPYPALQQSLRLLEQVQSARPNDINVMNNLAVTWSTIGQARNGEGDPRAALEADRQSLAWLQRAARLAPDDRRLVHNMLFARSSLVYQATLFGENPEPATGEIVTGLQALVDRHRDYITPLNTLGMTWWTQGVWDTRVGNDPERAMRAALAAFEQALTRRPDWDSARINHAGVVRQWYALSEARPDAELEALADAALASYRELEPIDGEKSEFGCLIAEILAARAQWRPPTEAVELLNEAYQLSEIEQNIEWAHLDCYRSRARIGGQWAIMNPGDAPVEGLWHETVAAVEHSQDPGLLSSAVRFAETTDRPLLAREWSERLPEVFR
ncbi:MAG: serine/threonine-protein kinase [Pseudomonadota bacterium]